MAISDSTPAPLPDLSDLPTRIVRVVCQLTGLVLIAVGVIYLLDVFSRVRSVLNDPQGISKVTSEFAEMIEADKMVLRTGPQSPPPVPPAGGDGPPAPAAEPAADNGFPVGKAVAAAMAFGWYLLFFWIPCAILAAGSRLIYWTLADSRHAREAIAEIVRRQGVSPRDRPRTLDLSGK